jgi:hypothetical protein
VTAPVNGGECTFNDKINQLICLFPVETDAVDSIYLGAKMPQTFRDDITQCLRSTRDKHGIKLFAAELHPENFDLLFNRIDYRST